MAARQLAQDLIEEGERLAVAQHVLRDVPPRRKRDTLPVHFEVRASSGRSCVGDPAIRQIQGMRAIGLTMDGKARSSTPRRNFPDFPWRFGGRLSREENAGAIE